MTERRQNSCPAALEAPVIISGTKLGLGGIRTHLLLLCRVFVSRGIHVNVLANGSHWSKAQLDELRALGVRVHLPPSWLLPLRFLSTLYSALASPLNMPRRIKSLYCVGPGFSHLWLHRLKPSRTLSINHELVVPPGPKSVAGRCAAGLDTTVANSKRVAEIMKGLWPQKPIKVVPFLTSDRPIPPPSRTTRRKEDRFNVVYLGRLVDHKRPDQLVRRWQTLSASGELAGARLDVYGLDQDGKMLSYLRRFVAETGQATRIQIHGAYDLTSLPRVLASSDLLVLPSLHEGLPLVLVEAMQHGVPFVATAAGGTEELGESNPDVIVTSTAWSDFEDGLQRMAAKIRRGEIDHRRLHRWVEDRYGYSVVSQRWLYCLSNPRKFFGLEN